jgi:hypothetical protein
MLLSMQLRVTQLPLSGYGSYGLAPAGSTKAIIINTAKIKIDSFFIIHFLLVKVSIGGQYPITQFLEMYRRNCRRPLRIVSLIRIKVLPILMQPDAMANCIPD